VSATIAHRAGPKNRKHVVLGAVGVTLVVLVGLAIYTYLQLSSARDDIDQATASAGELQTALESGNQPAAEASLRSLQDRIGNADATLGGFVFSTAAKLPVLGKNIDAARTVTSSLDRVADSGLPPLVEIADQFNGKTFNPQGGSINVEAIAGIGPNVAQSADVITKASDEIDQIDAGTLMNSLRGPVEDVQDKLGHAADVARRAETASGVIPQMLRGKHTYLLLFQNNAEIRATGGLPGAWAALEVNDGKMSLGKQGDGGSLGNLSYRATSISDEESELFDTKLVSDFRDINFTPDFPRAAEIGSEIIARETGIQVDGVLSLDPVTLSYLLEGLGPVALDDGSTLTSGNAVDVLLNGVYVNYPDPDAQDAFFASATKKVLDKVLSGEGDPTVLLRALTRAANEGRVAVWDKSSEVTGLLAGTALAGVLPVGEAAASTLGFYLNDATGAKMQYYLDYDVAAKATKCSAAGVQSYDTVMTLRSTAPADSATLPESIRGPGFGSPPGTMLMNLYVYAPDRGKVTKLSIDGQETVSFPATHKGRGVELVPVFIEPGQTVSVTTSIESGADQRGSARVLVTPSIKPGTNASTVKSAC
jgi:hypothetical protein